MSVEMKTLTIGSTTYEIVDENARSSISTLSKDKADKGGWNPDKYIGTDTNGHLVEKDAPECGAKTYVQAEEPTDAEVGALWYDTDEFTEEGTPTSNEKLIFTGAVSAEYDGTKPVTVDIPTGGSGGGYKPLTLLYETTVEADTTSFSQEIPACDVVELHILNYSETSIPGATFHRVCPNKTSGGNAVARYPIKLPADVNSGGAMEAVYRFERHEGFINLFCWLSMVNSGNGGFARQVMFQTMWDSSRFGGSNSFAYTDRIDFINFTGLTLATGVIIQIYGQKQEG